MSISEFNKDNYSIYGLTDPRALQASKTAVKHQEWAWPFFPSTTEPIPPAQVGQASCLCEL